MTTSIDIFEIFEIKPWLPGVRFPPQDCWANGSVLYKIKIILRTKICCHVHILILDNIAKF